MPEPLLTVASLADEFLIPRAARTLDRESPHLTTSDEEADEFPSSPSPSRWVVDICSPQDFLLTAAYSTRGNSNKASANGAGDESSMPGAKVAMSIGAHAPSADTIHARRLSAINVRRAAMVVKRMGRGYFSF